MAGNVFNRPMFQAGGEVTPIVIQSQKTDIGSARNPRPVVVNIEQENDKFYQRTRDFNGNLIGTQKEIDLEFSATRDPLDALQKQTESETLKGLGSLAVGLPLTVAAVATAPATGSAIGATALGLYARRVLAPKITQGFSKLANMFVRRNDDKITGPSVLGYSTLAVPPALGVRSILEDISPKKVDEITEETDPDRLSGSLFDPLKPKEPEEPEKPEIVYDKAKISNVLSDEKFDAFLNALAGTLNTGSFTAAGQAPLLAAKALQAGQDSGALDSVVAERNRTVNTDLAQSTSSFNKIERDIGRIEYALDVLAGDEDATGLAGFFGKVEDGVRSLFQKDSEDFDGLNARSKVDAIVDAIRQENIRELLGESGRTISNLDREIVAEIFGSITLTSPKAALKTKLNEIRDRFRRRLSESKDEVKFNLNYFIETNQNTPIGFEDGKIAAPIQRILAIKDPRTYQVPKYDPDQDKLVLPQGEIIDAGSLGD